MFGRLPVDFMFNIENCLVHGTTYNQFVDNWKDSIRETYKIARKYSTKSAGDEKKLHDKKVFGNTLKVGD